MATIASSGSQPVTATSPTPTITPAEVQTSVMRCWPSATRVAERWARPTRSSSSPTAPLTAVASTVMSRPSPSDSSGCGSSRRCTAETMMTAAATKIMRPSIAAEKYSALPWP